MNCKKCGSPLTESDRFCPNCGSSIEEQKNLNNLNSTLSGLNQPTNNPMNTARLDGQNPPSANATWLNGYNSSATVKANDKTVQYIIIGIVSVAVICIILALCSASIFSNNENKDSNKKEDNQTGITNPTTNTATKQTYKVNFGGFTFNIPNNLINEERNGALYIYDEEQTWVMQLNLQTGNFDKLKENKGQFASQLQQSGITCNNIKEQTYKGIEFITMELSYAGENLFTALAKVNSTYYIGISVVNQDNTFDYDLLDVAAPIISSMKQQTSTTNITINNNFDFNVFSQYAQ